MTFNALFQQTRAKKRRQLEDSLEDDYHEELFHDDVCKTYQIYLTLKLPKYNPSMVYRFPHRRCKNSSFINKLLYIFLFGWFVSEILLFKHCYLLGKAANKKGLQWATCDIAYKEWLSIKTGMWWTEIRFFYSIFNWFEHLQTTHLSHIVLTILHDRMRNLWPMKYTLCNLRKFLLRKI